MSGDGRTHVADNFDFDEVLGKLASCVANKNWFVMPELLKALVEHPAQEDVRNTLLDTIDYMSDKGGASFMLYTLRDLMTVAQKNKSIEGSYLLAKLADKWGEACDAGAKSDPDSTLSHLTSACSRMTADDPLNGKALPRWEAMIDAQWPLSGFNLECNLAIGYDTTNADFRHAALSRLAKLKDTEGETVLKMLNNVIDRGGFYSFKDNDPESLRLIGSTMADILEANKDKYDAKTITDTAWKVFSHCEGCDAAAEKKAARLYLDMAEKEANPDQAYNQFAGVLMRRNPHIAAESRDAALKILDLVDTGVLNRALGGGPDEVGRNILDCIFQPAVESKDDALAQRASVTMMNMVRTELSRPNTYSSYLYYNMAQELYAHFERGDPREAEVLNLWEGALAKSHKTQGDDYYARQMGWMLDSATAKGDSVTAAKAKQEWHDTIEGIAKRRPGEAFRSVQQIVVNAAHYQPDSALVAEARAVFPDLEERSGVKKVPAKVGNDDFLKMIGKKRQPGFKP